METTLDWKSWLTEGDQYLRAATPKTGKSRFNEEIRYNLLSMSFEKYVMAMLDFFRKLPDNHTYTDLFDALEGVVSLDQKLIERILQYENIQSICSIDKYYRTAPSDEQLTDLHGAILEIREIAHSVCKTAA